MSDFTDEQKQILASSNVWNEEGKIDTIKFAELMAKLNGTNEKDELKSILDALGVKYTEQTK